MAIYLRKDRFEANKTLFLCDNLAVVTLLNSKTSKYERVMSLARPIVLWTLTISSVCNKIANALSRGQMQRFRELVPNAENLSKKIGQKFLNLLR